MIEINDIVALINSLVDYDADIFTNRKVTMNEEADRTVERGRKQKESEV